MSDSIAYIGLRHFRRAIGSTSAAPIPVVTAPTLSSLSYDQGDITGAGASIVIAGTDFSAVTSVFFGATSASFTIDSSVQITATLPAHVAGTVNVTAVNSGGTSNALTFEYWSPAQLSLGHWERATATWAGAPWSGVASAGSSGTRTFQTTAVDPTAGSTISGFQALSFTTDSRLLDAVGTWGDVASTSAYTMCVVAKVTSAGTRDAVNRYNEQTFFGDNNVNIALGCTFSTGGFSCFHYDDSTFTFTGPEVAQATGSWFMGLARYNGTDIKVSTNGGADVSEAKTPVLTGFEANSILLNRSTLGANTGVNGEIAEVFMMPSYISDANKTKVAKYLRQRYGQAF